MRALLVGLWKEARDQRAVVIAALVALPVLVLGAAWAFGDHLWPHQFSTTALFVPPAALALFLIAVASELFGGERRRGTLDFARRLPRGLGRSLGAKLLAYVLGSALFVAWGWCVAYVACSVFSGAPAPTEFVRMSLENPDPIPTMILFGLFCLGFWVLLVSTWIPQGGAAVLGAGLLLGLLALPAYLRLKDSTWLLAGLKPRSLGDLLVPLGVLAGAALLVLVVSYLRGNRRLSSAWAPAWRGLALLGVMAGGAYAAGASAVERTLTIDPHDDGFRIAGGYVGAGGRYAFLNVGRSDRAWWASDTPFHTPKQPWIVDLTTGAHRRAGEFEEGWYCDPQARQAPQPIVLLFTGAAEGVSWYDATTTKLRTTLPFGVRNLGMQAWERKALAALAWHRDPEGRALWFEGDALVREGDPLPKALNYRVQPTGHAYPILGGWSRYTWKAGRSESDFFTVEATTGKMRPVPASVRRGSLAYLSPSILLVQRGKRDPKARTLSGLAVVDLDDLDAEPRAVEAPPGVEWVADSNGTLVVAAGEAGASLLVMTGTHPEQRRLARWSPLTGEVRELSCDGQPIVGHSWYELARVPGGRMVVRIQRYALTNDGSKPDLFQHLLLDAASDEVRALNVVGHGTDILAILPDGAVVGIELGKRLVRYGPEPGTRTVLFPR